jgi:hypothetical protein
MASAYFPNTHPVKINDGSAAAPAYTFTGDTDTGIYRDATGPKVAVSIGGTKQVEIAAGSTIFGTSDTITISGDQIKSNTGDIDFHNDNLITTGAITAGVGGAFTVGAARGNVATTGTLGCGAITLTDGSGITSAGSAISFGAENLSTTGTLGCGAITCTSVDAASGDITTTGTIEGNALEGASLDVTGTASADTHRAETLMCTQDGEIQILGNGDGEVNDAAEDRIKFFANGTATYPQIVFASAGGDNTGIYGTGTAVGNRAIEVSLDGVTALSVTQHDESTANPRCDMTQALIGNITISTGAIQSASDQIDFGDDLLRCRGGLIVEKLVAGPAVESLFTVAHTTGNVSTTGSMTVSGLSSLNGGIACDTDKFTVADGTGNTLIAGTLGVTGEITGNASSATTAATCTGNSASASEVGTAISTTTGAGQYNIPYLFHGNFPAAYSAGNHPLQVDSTNGPKYQFNTKVFSVKNILINSGGGLDMNGENITMGTGHLNSATSGTFTGALSCGSFSSTGDVTTTAMIHADNLRAGGDPGQTRVEFPDSYSGSSNFSECTLYGGDSGSSRIYFIGYRTTAETTERPVFVQAGSGSAAGGRMYAAGFYGTGVHSWSDDRCKHNEKSLESALATVNKLNVKDYIKTAEMYAADHTLEDTSVGHREVGVIAQEIAEINELKDFTETTMDGETEKMCVNYQALFVYGLKAIQELSQQVDALTARVLQLESGT